MLCQHFRYTFGRRSLDFFIDSDLVLTNTFQEHKEIQNIVREITQPNKKSIFEHIIILTDKYRSEKNRLK